MKTATKTTSKRRIFNLGILSPITQQNNAADLFKISEAACALGFKVFTLAVGDEVSQEKCFKMAEEHPDNFIIQEDLPQNFKSILESVDAIIFPTEPEKVLLEEIIKRGIVPIIPANCGLENFNASTETGEAFTFEKGNFWQFCSAMIRASENFQFSYDWNNLKKKLKHLNN